VGRNGSLILESTRKGGNLTIYINSRNSYFRIPQINVNLKGVRPSRNIKYQTPISNSPFDIPMSPFERIPDYLKK